MPRVKLSAVITRLAIIVLPLSALVAGSPASAFSISTCPPGISALCAEGTPTEGWDGPGLGSATIDYYVGNPGQVNNGLPAGILLSDFDAAITAAMSTWSSVVQVSFNRVDDALNDPTGANTFQAGQITIYAAAGVHSDGFPFDGAWNPSTGAGNVLAHAFGPPDISGGEGNVHLDADETWVTTGASIGATSATIDLQTILLHELGHSLGLAHIDDNLNSDRGIVMQPGYFGPLTALAADDIAGIQSLYCATGQTCDGTGGPVVPEPTSVALFGLSALVVGVAVRRRSRRC